MAQRTLLTEVVDSFIYLGTSFGTNANISLVIYRNKIKLLYRRKVSKVRKLSVCLSSVITRFIWFPISFTFLSTYI